MLRRFTKKRTLAALTVVAVLAAAGAAFAYFTSTGSGTGSATIGSATAFNVTVNNPTGGPLYPGSGSESLSYTIKNAGSGTQNLSATSVAVTADTNGDVKHNGASVAGCKASWFSAVDNAPAYGPLAGGASVNGSVTVTMPDNTTDNQDACQSASPDVAVNAS
jgi:hypothetical protein